MWREKYFFKKPVKANTPRVCMGWCGLGGDAAIEHDYTISDPPQPANVQSCISHISKSEIAVIGLGGCGTHLMEAKSLSSSGIENLILIRNKDLLYPDNRARLASGLPEIRIYNFNQLDDVVKACSNMRLCFIFGGLGGNSCEYLPALCKELNEYGVKIIESVILSFSFEGKARRYKAEDVLEKLKNIANDVFAFDNDELITDETPNTTLSKMMDYATQKVLERLSEKIINI